MAHDTGDKEGRVVHQGSPALAAPAAIERRVGHRIPQGRARSLPG